jgi:hypothetical protein
MQRITRRDYLDLRSIAAMGMTALADWTQLDARYTAFESFLLSYQTQRGFVDEAGARARLEAQARVTADKLAQYQQLDSRSRRVTLMGLFQNRLQAIGALVAQLRARYALYDSAERSFFFVLVLSAAEQRSRAVGEGHLALAAELYEPLVYERDGLQSQLHEEEEGMDTVALSDEIDRLERAIERHIDAAEQHAALYMQIWSLEPAGRAPFIEALGRAVDGTTDWARLGEAVRQALGARSRLVTERIHERRRVLENELPLARTEDEALDLTLRLEQLTLLLEQQ